MGLEGILDGASHLLLAGAPLAADLLDRRRQHVGCPEYLRSCRFGLVGFRHHDSLRERIVPGQSTT